MKPADFDQMLASAVLEMAQEPSVPATVERVVALATEAIASCDAAALKVFQQGVPSVLAVTDPALGELLEGQIELGSAPMFDSCRERVSIYVADLREETRWPAYARALTENLGIHTVYVLPLAHQDKPSGVLGLYAKAVDAFDDEDKTVASVVAAHATAALAEAVGQEQLQAALDSRTVIGQATGIVMERFGLDAAAAFGVLQRLSQTQNVKLRDLAAQVVHTGRIE